MPLFPVLRAILLNGGAGGVGGFVVGLFVASNIGATTENNFMLVLIVCTIAGIVVQSGWKALQTANQPKSPEPPTYTFPAPVGTPKTETHATTSPLPGPGAAAPPPSASGQSHQPPPTSNGYNEWSLWIAGRFGGTPEQIHVATTAALNALRSGWDSSAAAEAAKRTLTPVASK